MPTQPLFPTLTTKIRKVGRAAFLLLLVLSLAGCATALTPAPTPTPTPDPSTYALVGLTLIDGTGSAPLPNAVVLVREDRIVAAGARATVKIPAGVRVIDFQGAYVLPGFINAHVHYGFDEKNLQAWAQGGVTTVRDEGILNAGSFKKFMDFRDASNEDPRNARLVSAGAMLTVPGGYGSVFVESPEDARQKVLSEIELGVDLIKISMEDGYAGKSNMPKLTAEEISTILATAHEKKVKVSGHVTQFDYLVILVKAGVDDIAHVPYSPVSDSVWKEMIAKNIAMTPTFTVFRNYGAPVSTCVSNLRSFVALGGRVALGNDYGGGPGSFELGIPMYEIEQMAAAGMTPMQIIVASTQNAAFVSGIEDQVGTVEPGKIADLLVLSANPLENLKNLAAIRMVIHNGVIIRETQ